MKSEFDICIIGAGMAGATIAAYLAPKGIKVALIDHFFKEKNNINKMCVHLEHTKVHDEAVCVAVQRPESGVLVDEHYH